jgi:quercetin dioxygenase-like cupin family protein
MTTAPSGYALPPGEGERIGMLGTEQIVLAGTSTNASFLLLHSDMPAGMGPPPHIHDDQDEAFYVLQGRLRVKCGADEWVLQPGGFAYLPRGVMHQPIVEGADPVRALIITSGTGLDEFFAKVSSEVTASGQPPSLELMDRVGAPYGLRHFPLGTL